MRKLTLALTAAIALISAQALAADLGRMPVKASPVDMVAPAANWNGFYIGGHIGGVWNNDDDGFGPRDGTGPGPGNGTGPGLGNGTGPGGGNSGSLIGGGQIGFNWQAGGLVFGVEGTGAATDVDTFNGRINSIFTATGRIGAAFGRTLLYVKGGYAGLSHRDNIFGDDWQNGWTVGVGLEYMFAPSWTLGLEYSFIRGEDDFSCGVFVCTGFARTELHQVVARVNYLFNWAAPPLRASY